MMYTSIHLPGVSDDEDRTLNRLLEQLGQRRSRNLLRASYYDGKHAIRQVGSIIPPQYYRMGIVLGWSAKAVDILARRTNLDGFVWPDGDIDSLGLRDVWDDNFLGAESSSAMISSLIHGVSFLVNTPGVNDNEPASLVHVKDALDATGDWNARARRMDNLLSITSRDDDGNPTGLALYLDGKTVIADKDRGIWSVDVSFHNWGVPAEPLVYKPRVGRPFGSSRISRPVMSLHDQALRTVIRLEGQSDVYSLPQLVLLGADASVFKNADGSTKAAWQLALGRVFALPDDEDAENPRASVQQFQAASPQPHIDTLEQKAQLFSGETSIPLSSLGVHKINDATSADSYIASREDLISEAEGATDDWAPAFRRSITRALAIANGETSIPEEWRSIDTKWRSPMHLSRAAQADAGMKQISAIPWLSETSVGLELLGLDEQQIARAMADKRKAQGREVLRALTQPAAAPAEPVTPVANDNAE